MSVFHFKQFTIHQDKTAMKVGTDSILLGAWLRINLSCENVLDVGTGTGLLALMIAQKNARVKITGLEIDEEASVQAKQNIELSKWKDRIKIVNIDANNWTSPTRYDLFISNPPYFSDSIRDKNSSRINARHQLEFKIQNLLDLWIKLGSNCSELACILPVNQALLLIDLVLKNSYYLKLQTLVRSNKKGKVIRQLLLFSKEKAPTQVSELCIYSEDRSYSNTYIELTKDFYLGLT
jgi:tRNA1Val (adenine37-N6)-methyltransferase